MAGSLLHTDGLHRCPWPGKDDAVYVAYHDTEWGVPEYDDRALYDKVARYNHFIRYDYPLQLAVV